MKKKSYHKKKKKQNYQQRERKSYWSKLKSKLPLMRTHNKEKKRKWKVHKVISD
jgi:hypothetical protein